MFSLLLKDLISDFYFTIGWRKEVARLSFFLKAIQDKWGVNNKDLFLYQYMLFLVFENLRFNSTWKASAATFLNRIG